MDKAYTMNLEEFSDSEITLAIGIVKTYIDDAVKAFKKGNKESAKSYLKQFKNCPYAKYFDESCINYITEEIEKEYK